MKVSVIVPTKDRQHFYQSLYQCFRDQTHTDKELVVLDDSMLPATFFRSLGDPSVRYYHTAPGMSLGRKRNLLVEFARGEVIAQFDDDDYYAPGYLQTMLDSLGNADLVKLAGWYTYMNGSSATGGDFFGYWDTESPEQTCFALRPGGVTELRQSQGVQDRNLYGYGFSYVFRKSVFDHVEFPDINFAEDYELVLRMREAGLKAVHRHDDQGIALHMVHDSNCSSVFPQYRLPPRWARQVFGQRVDRYLHHRRR